jgi:hypothetical protein
LVIVNMATPAGEPEQKGLVCGEPSRRRDVLLRCLAVKDPEMLPPLRQAFACAEAAGAVPFEVIAGAPFGRYGARITFRPGPGAEPRELARAFGLDGHPWGAPAWVGVRVLPGGAVHAKAYHTLDALDDRFTLPAGLPTGLQPVMAALDLPDRGLGSGAKELYLCLGPDRSWTSFVKTAVAALGEVEAGEMLFSPHPRPSEGGFCLSLRWREGELTTLSLYATQRSLPPDDEIRRAWIAGMDGEDREVYEAALAGVRDLGRLPASHAWHGMLAWTLERGGGWQRAASLRVPGSQA